MKGIIQFFKTTLFGGFFVVLPMVLLYILMGELFDAAIALGTPIADLLPEDAFGDADTEQVVAALLLLVVCFLTGLALRTRTGNRILDWLEQKVLEPIPGYTVLRALSQSFSGDDKNEFFEPAVFNSSDGIRTPVLIVEEHAYRVIVPIPPTPAMGTIPIAPGNLVLCLCLYS